MPSRRPPTAVALTLLAGIVATLVAVGLWAGRDGARAAVVAPLAAAVDVRDSHPDDPGAPGPGLRVRAGVDGGLAVETWLRFDVPADPPAPARLWVWASEEIRAPLEVVLAERGWTGPELSWADRPPTGPTIGTLDGEHPPGWVRIELGPLAPGPATLVLRGSQAQTIELAGAASERPPTLELGGDGGAPPAGDADDPADAEPTTTAPAPTTTTIPVPPPPELLARPYDPSSPWNTPVPPDAVVHPDSDAFVARLGRSGEPLTSDPTQFSVPVYEAAPGTPLVDVEIRTPAFSWVDGDETIRDPRPREVRIPIPAGATPSAGTDGELVVIDLASGAEWGLYQAGRRPDGTWTAQNGYRYDIRWSAAPPEEFFSRGAGVPYSAGLVRPEEVLAGRVEHALAFAAPDPGPGHVPPATKSDGRGVAGLDLPEGARLRLDPALTDAELRAFGLGDRAVTVARAMQTHGMYLIDISGRPKVVLEAEESADWIGILDEHSLSGIPFDRFDVVLPPECADAADLDSCWSTARW